MMNPDAFGCIASCTSNEACGETCMAGFETSYCCDMTAHQCFVNPEEGPCPLHAGSCDAAGCPAGEMCVAFINPEFIASPACYTLPMVCGDDPTCSCLAAAGVCGDGGFPFCADGGGASISCGL
jgi:hypothetical protein